MRRRHVAEQREQRNGQPARTDADHEQRRRRGKRRAGQAEAHETERNQGHGRQQQACTRGRTIEYAAGSQRRASPGAHQHRHQQPGAAFRAEPEHEQAALIDQHRDGGQQHAGDGKEQQRVRRPDDAQRFHAQKRMPLFAGALAVGPASLFFSPWRGRGWQHEQRQCRRGHAQRGRSQERGIGRCAIGDQSADDQPRRQAEANGRTHARGHATTAGTGRDGHHRRQGAHQQQRRTDAPDHPPGEKPEAR